MKAVDLGELVALAAIWGASFLFMRLGAGEFGPVALAGIRVTGAALCLLPLVAWRGELATLRRHWGPILVVGLANSALPFLAYSWAALTITAGLAAIFNATAPLWGALIAWLWLKEAPGPARVLGLAIGFVGVLGLFWDQASFRPGADASGWALVAVLAATLCYGLAANYAKRHLAGVPPLAVAGGSQLAATLVLLPPALWWWPAATPSPTAWLAAALLAVACTGLAYVMYFRLIARVGPANAIAVTFLIPVFAMLWGALLLDEAVSAEMLAGGAVILLGTALATGLLKGPALRAAPR